MTIGAPMHDFPCLGHRRYHGKRIPRAFRAIRRMRATPELLRLRSPTGWQAPLRRVRWTPIRNVMALNGTREGLYNCCHGAVPRNQKNGEQIRIILCPNPFYQVYMVASISVRAQALTSCPCHRSHDRPFAGLSPACLRHVLNRTAIAAYICSPANPQGAVADRATIGSELIGLAEKYDFKHLSPMSAIPRFTAMRHPTGAI